MKIRLLIGGLLIAMHLGGLYAQPMAYMGTVADQKVELPLVFQIGEYEESYEHLLGEHPDMLLSVCNNNMTIAYDKWMAFLMEIEQYAESVDYDILGVKMWINVFWDKNGKIEHIAFHLKPNSKNVPPESIQTLLENFIANHRLNVKWDKPFSHYGSATFPLFPRRIKR